MPIQSDCFETKLMSLQMQSQHQMVKQNYWHCKCSARANIKWSYKIIGIANVVPEPTSNGQTKLLSCKCRANIKWSYKIIVIANAEPERKRKPTGI